MKDLLRRISHHPVDEQACAINRILRGHFDYYGIAGNARKLHWFWNFTRARVETLSIEAPSERAAYLGGLEGSRGTAPGNV